MRLGRVRWWYSDDQGQTWQALRFTLHYGGRQVDQEALWAGKGEPGWEFGFFGQRRLK